MQFSTEFESWKVTHDEQEKNKKFNVFELIWIFKCKRIEIKSIGYVLVSSSSSSLQPQTIFYNRKLQFIYYFYNFIEFVCHTNFTWLLAPVLSFAICLLEMCLYWMYRSMFVAIKLRFNRIHCNYKHIHRLTQLKFASSSVLLVLTLQSIECNDASSIEKKKKIIRWNESWNFFFLNIVEMWLHIQVSKGIVDFISSIFFCHYFIAFAVEFFKINYLHFSATRVYTLLTFAANENNSSSFQTKSTLYIYICI